MAHAEATAAHADAVAAHESALAAAHAEVAEHAAEIDLYRERAAMADIATQRRTVARMLAAALRGGFDRLRSRGATRHAELRGISVQRRTVLRMLMAKISSHFKMWKHNARARDHIVVTKTVKAGKKMQRDLSISEGCLITCDPTGKRPPKSYSLLRFRDVHIAGTDDTVERGTVADPNDFVVLLMGQKRGIFKEKAKKIRYTAKSRFDAELIVAALRKHSKDAQADEEAATIDSLKPPAEEPAPEYKGGAAAEEEEEEEEHADLVPPPPAFDAS